MSYRYDPNEPVQCHVQMQMLSQSGHRAKLSLAVRISTFAGNEVNLRTEAVGLDNKSSLLASRGHIHDIVETPLPKVLESITKTATPQAFFVEAYPNPSLLKLFGLLLDLPPPNSPNQKFFSCKA